MQLFYPRPVSIRLAAARNAAAEMVEDRAELAASRQPRLAAVWGTLVG